MTKLMHSFSLLGFNCFAESNFYVFSQVKLLWLIILYVDDLLITRSLASKIEVYRSHGGIFLSQHRYLRQLLETYGMSNFRPLLCPMDPNSMLSRKDDPMVMLLLLSNSLLTAWLCIFSYNRSAAAINSFSHNIILQSYLNEIISNS